MKKTITLSLIAMLFLSMIPLSLAENGKDIENTNAMQEKRNIDTTALMNAKERFREAKEAFQEQREAYIKEKAMIKDAKKEAKECINNTRDCEAKKEKLRENEKSLMLKTADIYIKHLEQLKEKIKASPLLTEEEATAMIATLDNYIQELNTAKDKVKQAQTKEELIVALKNLKDVINNIRKDTKSFINTLHERRVGLIVERAERLENRLEKILQQLRERNISTTTIEPLVSDFNAKISEARALHTEAVELFAKAKQTTVNTEKERLMKEANQKIKEAQQKLREAHSILVEIVKMIGEKTPNLKVSYNQGIIRERLQGTATVE